MEDNKSKGIKNKYTRKIGVKVSESYYQHLHKLAKENAGSDAYSLSDFVRPYLPDYDSKDLTHISRKKIERVVYKNVSKDLLLCLSKIGNNVNQISRALNRAVYYGSLDDVNFIAMQEELEKILDELKRLENAG